MSTPADRCLSQEPHTLELPLPTERAKAVQLQNLAALASAADSAQNGAQNGPGAPTTCSNPLHELTSSASSRSSSSSEPTDISWHQHSLWMAAFMFAWAVAAFPTTPGTPRWKPLSRHSVMPRNMPPKHSLLYSVLTLQRADASRNQQNSPEGAELLIYHLP